jgi:CBS domain-containing protein
MDVGDVCRRDVVYGTRDTSVAAAAKLMRQHHVGDASCAATLRVMRDKGVRRLPVVDGRGVLAGVISVDDLLPRLVDELSEFPDLAARGRQREVETRPSASEKTS